MSRNVLPKPIREKVAALSREGLSTVEIFDLILNEAEGHVDSHQQLSRCITAIVSKGSDRLPKQDKTATRRHVVPTPKSFDTSPYRELIGQLSTTMQEKAFENACEPIVSDILENYEGFECLVDANRASGVHNPPFDYMAVKHGVPYLIEFKGSLNSFNAPGETQKRRMKELVSMVQDLKLALLQVRLGTGEYRIFYDDELNLFFDGQGLSLEPVINWVSEQLARWKSEGLCGG